MNNAALEKLKSQLEKALSAKKPAIHKAAFDADGTLWPSDVGKDFFHYQAAKGFFKEKYACPFSEFDSIYNLQGRKQALIWLAKAQAGFSLKTLKLWAKDFLREHPVKMFSFQKNLIKWLTKKKVKIFIVSSSLTWVLEQALEGYNIPHIIGVETLVENGTITDKPVLPAPVGKDKVLAFKRKAGESSLPIFVAGNTLSDKALLESATDIRLVLNSALPGSRNYESEKSLLKIAKQRNWLHSTLKAL